jgi:hypothetical protein
MSQGRPIQVGPIYLSKPADAIILTCAAQENMINFCDPTHFVKSPSPVAYYRNLAMVSTQTMQAIGLNTASHEAGQPLSFDKAEQLARYFSSVASTFIVTNPSLVTRQRHIERVFSNLGESIGNLWQDEAEE